MTVKDFIKELEKCNPDAEVLYAYDEYGRNGIHGSISQDEYVVMKQDGKYFFHNNEIISFLDEDKDDLIDEYVEIINMEGNQVKPAIKLFSR